MVQEEARRLLNVSYVALKARAFEVCVWWDQKQALSYFFWVNKINSKNSKLAISFFFYQPNRCNGVGGGGGGGDGDDATPSTPSSPSC